VSHVRVVALALVLAGCGGLAPTKADAPTYAPPDQTASRAARSASHPLVMEWPAADRAALEARRSRGVIVVRYGQGEVEVLARCEAKAAAYRYVGLTPKRETLAIKNREELHAAMPIHAAHLEATLAQGDELAVTLDVVGVYESEPRTWTSADLHGDCAGATHVVAGLTVGAFEIFAARSSSASAGASAFGASAGGARERSLSTLKRDGSAAACAAGTTNTSAPPVGCGGLLRIEVVAIQVPVATGTCAPGDVACMSARAQGGCAAGFVRKGDVCEAVNPERPGLLEGLRGGK
jgi:hypothetical protein